MVLVVDNDSGPDTAKELARWPDVNVLRLQRNLGGAGGFAAGLRWSAAHGYDWTWMMDDDALPQPTALAALIPSMERHDGTLVALASTVAPQVQGALVANVAPQEITTDRAMFVGFAVPKRVVEELGVPREDFFIYTDDSDYCWRIQRAGGKILRVPGSQIVHADWSTSPGNLVITVAGRSFLVYPRVVGWKKYYLARNRIVAARSHSRLRTARAIVQSYALLGMTAVFAPAHVRLVARGLWDGLRGRTGITVLPN